MSSDGGATWRNISAGTKLDGTCLFSTLDTAGALHVVSAGSRDLWSWRDGNWQKRIVALDWERTPHAVACDLRNPNRIFAISDGGGTSRSLDGGKTWTMLGPDMVFANRLGWLPQKAGWRSNAGIFVDRDGVCWIAQGNEGMLRFTATDREDAKNPPRWTIDSVGIEELVTHDVIMPPKGNAVFAVEDATGLVTADLRKFVARQIPLQDQLLSNGTGLAYCPNAPEYLAVVTADIHHTGSGKSYSGFSADGGKTWSRFGGLPSDPSTGKAMAAAGSIAISRRGNWTTGNDHLVWLPNGDGPAFYSHDGGRSWKASEGFPLKNGYWIFAPQTAFTCRRSVHAGQILSRRQLDRRFLCLDRRGEVLAPARAGRYLVIQPPQPARRESDCQERPVVLRRLGWRKPARFVALQERGYEGREAGRHRVRHHALPGCGIRQGARRNV